MTPDVLPRAGAERQWTEWSSMIRIAARHICSGVELGFHGRIPSSRRASVESVETKGRPWEGAAPPCDMRMRMRRLVRKVLLWCWPKYRRCNLTPRHPPSQVLDNLPHYGF